MALNDASDKLEVAADYLEHKPLRSREWQAAWEHVNWVADNAAPGDYPYLRACQLRDQAEARKEDAVDSLCPAQDPG